MRKNNLIVPIFCLAIVAFWSFDAQAEETEKTNIGVLHSGDNSGVAVTATQEAATPGSSEAPMYDETVEAAPVAGGGSVRVEPMVARTWSERLYRDLVTAHPCFRRFPPKDDPVGEELVEELEDDVVDPVSVMVSAVALARVDGAGLVVQPGRDWVYVGVPTLAHARHGEVSTSVSVLGLDVPVSFTASRFVFDFGNGAPPVVSAVPGQPYPDMSIQGTYVSESEGARVTLTTLWDATVTHPLTGDVLEVPGALRTVESSAPFRVVRSRHRLIAPEEFGKPH